MIKSLSSLLRTPSIWRGASRGAHTTNGTLKMTQNLHHQHHHHHQQQHRRWVSLSSDGKRHLEWEKLMRAELSEKTKRLADGLLRGERVCLAKSITLVESSRLSDKVECEHLLTYLGKKNPQSKYHKEQEDAKNDSVLPSTKPTRSFRIGISGPPGVGKSTFIEGFGLQLVEMGFKVAVLAIDPSSTRSGGSILGDKTRMNDLSNHKNAYIRPSPSGSSLGGVTRGSSASAALCEHAGFDVILVETVGVGQNETAVEGVVDLFLLLGLPGAGDELQGIKRGIIELADIIAINKADGPSLKLAKQSQRQHKSALRLLRPKIEGWEVPVVTCSALTKEGLPELWGKISKFWKTMAHSGELVVKRKGQRVEWMWKMTMEDIQFIIRTLPGVDTLIDKLEHEVEDGKRNPGQASHILLKAVFDKVGYPPSK